MWCAQIGHESVGLKYMEEIASDASISVGVFLCLEEATETRRELV